MDLEKIGKYIAKCRKKINLTQEQLADLMNVSVKSISKWECGMCLPDISKMQDLCYFLKTNLFNLLNGEDSEFKFFIKKVGGIAIQDKNHYKRYQVKYSKLDSQKVKKLKDIKENQKKHIIQVKIMGFDIEEKDGFTHGTLYGTDGSMEVILTLNDNGEYQSRKVIDNIKIGEEYLCKGFIFDIFPKCSIPKNMIVEEIEKVIVK